jgi:multiple sugar transport system permease protein
MSTSNQTIARSQARTARWRRWTTSYAMLAPFLLLFMVFTLWPLLQSAYLSLTNYTGLKEPQFVGLQNYTNLISDQRFIRSMVNVIRYTIIVVVLNTALGLALALVFQTQGRFIQVMRTLFFLPAVTSSIATFVVWSWILSGQDYGLGNTILRVLGQEPISFLATPHLAVPIMVLLALWSGAGMTMIFFLAGLRAIPREYLDAAAIDGATPAQQLMHITIPLLRPTMVYVIITGGISAFQVFDVGYVLFSSANSVGGMLDSALTPVLYLYYRAFTRFQFGYASAIAWVLFAVIIVLSLFNLHAGRGNEAD